MSSKRRSPRITDLIRRPTDEGSTDPSRSDAPDEEPRPEGEDPAGEEPARPETPPREPHHDPASASPSPALDPSRRDVESEAREIRRDLLAWTTHVFEQARSDPFDPAGLDERIDQMARDAVLLGALYAETFRDTQGEDALAAKSVRVAVYALRLGRALCLDMDRLILLGTAALLQKVGLLRLPPGLVDKPGALTRRERARLQEHPRLGHAIVLESLGENARDVAQIVLQAHERVDGSGYPEGLRGDAIRREALLVGLVDVFEAMIQPRPYRERLVPFAAVKELLEHERERFPQDVLRAFVGTFSVFPPYTYVRLNSNAIARVLETEPAYPLRPTISIVVDANGRRLTDAPVIRLREAPLLYITGPLRQEEAQR